MSELRVTPAELRRAAEELHVVAQDLRSGAANLDSEVNSLIGRSWSGEASAAYGAIWREWHSGAAQVTDALTVLSTLIDEAATGYARTDGTAAETLGGNG